MSDALLDHARPWLGCAIGLLASLAGLSCSCLSFWPWGSLIPKCLFWPLGLQTFGLSRWGPYCSGGLTLHHNLVLRPPGRFPLGRGGSLVESVGYSQSSWATNAGASGSKANLEVKLASNAQLCQRFNGDVSRGSPEPQGIHFRVLVSQCSLGLDLCSGPKETVVGRAC